MGEEKYSINCFYFLQYNTFKWSYSYRKGFQRFLLRKGRTKVAVWLIFNLRGRGFYQIFTWFYIIWHEKRNLSWGFLVVCISYKIIEIETMLIITSSCVTLYADKNPVKTNVNSHSFSCTFIHSFFTECETQILFSTTQC